MQNSRKLLNIKCKIDGCDRSAMYLEKELCQKHYFRIMRNGHPKLLLSSEKEKGIRKRKEFYITPNGYKRIYSFGHPLARKNWIFEHRFLMHKKYGDNLPPCGLCGKQITWGNCHIDHIDNDRLNNSEENLRPLCRPCNTCRTKRRTIPRFEYEGQLLSITELSKIDGVQVCRSHIKSRMKLGMSVKEAMFSKNITRPKLKILQAANPID